MGRVGRNQSVLEDFAADTGRVRGVSGYVAKLAFELRAELKLGAYEKLGPCDTAYEYDIPIFQLSELGVDPAR